MSYPQEPHQNFNPDDGSVQEYVDMELIAAQLLYRVDQLTDRPSESNQNFFADLLNLLVQTVSATKGTVWRSNEGNIVALVESVSELEQRSGLNEDEKEFVRTSFFENPTANFRLTEPHRELDQSLNRCCLLVPLFDHAQCIAMISLIVYVGESADAMARLEILQMACERIRRSYMMAHFANAEQELKRLKIANEVTQSVGQHIRIKPAIHETVNQLRDYLKADRVTLCFKHGKKCVVKGVSNQAIFNKRSNVIRRIEQLATRVANLEQMMWFPKEDGDYAASLQKLVDRYFESANSVSVCVIPLYAEGKRRDDPEDIAATIQSDDQRRECIGVLVVERMDEPLQKARVIRRWSRVEKSISDSINNARTYDSLFLMPVWRKLGAFADFYRGHTMRKAWLITAAVVAAIASLIVIPGDFKLRGDGVIQPVERQHVFAETDGIVEQIQFVDGQTVGKDDLLLKLTNPDLSARIAEVEGKLKEEEQQLRTVTLQRVGREFESDDELRDLVRQTTASEARIDGLQKQLSILKQNESQLKIYSPMAGQVITWDSKQRLIDRPVDRGDRLLTIAKSDSEWEVELRVPDKRAGYMLSRWYQNESMKASFVLASNPREVFEGNITEIAPGSNVDDKDNENVVRVRIRLTQEEFQKIQFAKPGTTIIGHVYCGRASIGYCKLYEFFDWTQRMWFRFIS